MISCMSLQKYIWLRTQNYSSRTSLNLLYNDPPPPPSPSSQKISYPLSFPKKLFIACHKKQTHSLASLGTEHIFQRTFYKKAAQTLFIIFKPAKAFLQLPRLLTHLWKMTKVQLKPIFTRKAKNKVLKIYLQKSRFFSPVDLFLCFPVLWMGRA